jgi:hypothetical protein
MGPQLEGSPAKRTGKTAQGGMGRKVVPQIGQFGKRTVTKGALKRSLLRMYSTMGIQVRLLAKAASAQKGAREAIFFVRRTLVRRAQLVGRKTLLAALNFAYMYV